MNTGQSKATEAVQKVESIIKRRQQGTERLRRSWNSGELTLADLPCSRLCTGSIVVEVNDERLLGRCPVYMKHDVCIALEGRQAELTARLKLAGFGQRYLTPDPTRIRAMRAVEEYLGKLREHLDNGRGMVITGDVGVGKTMTLSYLAKKLLEADVGVWRVMVNDFVGALNDAEASREYKSGLIRRAMSVEVLMWDDLGSGEIEPKILGVMERIVEHRYANHKPTIVATNMPRDVLVANVALRRMVDRWRETNMMVSVGGASQRHA